MTAPIAHIESVGGDLVRTNLRSALYALASDPRARRSPETALAGLRVVVDIARSQIDQAQAAGGTTEEAHRATVRLTDAAVVGLLHFARVALDGQAVSMIAPVSCVATGDYASSMARIPFASGLLVLLEEHRIARARSEAVAGFVARGLADLGIEIETSAKTVDEAARLLVLPAFAGWFRRRRWITGQQDLFVQFDRRAVINQSILTAPV
jgi:hypothetical protein